jgi:hypothetical protein
MPRVTAGFAMAALLAGAFAALGADPADVSAAIAAGDAALEKLDLERRLALPTAWVTDDYYRGLARTNLVRVQGHLE